MNGKPDLSLEEGIISALGIENLSDKRKTELLKKATQLVERRVMLRFLDSITEEEKDEANRVAADKKAFLEYMAKKMPNLDEVFLEEAHRVKEELMLAAIEEEIK